MACLRNLLYSRNLGKKYENEQDHDVLTPQDVMPVMDVARFSRRPSSGQSAAAAASASASSGGGSAAAGAGGPAAVSDLLAATIRNTEEKVVEVRRRAEEAVQEVSEWGQGRGPRNQNKERPMGGSGHFAPCTLLFK